MYPDSRQLSGLVIRVVPAPPSSLTTSLNGCAQLADDHAAPAEIRCTAKRGTSRSRKGAKAGWTPVFLPTPLSHLQHTLRGTRPEHQTAVRTAYAWSLRRNPSASPASLAAIDCSWTKSATCRGRCRRRLRREDIPPLVVYFVLQYSERMSKQISQISHQAIDDLVGYAWPGKVRELQNLSQAGEYVVVEIEDTGPGIPNELRERISAHS